MNRLLLVFALLALAPSLHAQKVDLDSLTERYAAESEIAALRRRDFSLARATATSPEAQLERGMLLIRLHQLTREARDADIARDMFERAAKKLPGDARPYYGLALARLGGPIVRVPSPGGVLDRIVIAQSFAEIVKRDPVSLAKRDLKKALELDSTFVSVAVQLANVAVDTRDRDHMNVAVAALRRMVAAGRGGTVAAVALSEVEAALGNVQAAEVAADAATTMATGTDRVASAAHARAAALLRQRGKEEEAARVYFQGLEDLTTEAAQAYYDAVEPIVSDRERDTWQLTDLAARREWLRRFWNVRAAAAGVTAGERMAEHYRRLATAHDKYRRQGKRGAAPGGSLVAAKYKDDALPFDDRGLIYVRHGAPDEVVNTSDADLRPNETWVYHGNGETQLYHFVVLRGGTDYRLVDDLIAALDPSLNELPADAAEKLLRDRQLYDSRYGLLAASYSQYALARRRNDPDGMNRAVESIRTRTQDLEVEMREQALTALGTDSDRPDFKGDLPFYYDLYSFKGKQGRTDVTAAAAIPGRSLFSQSMGTQFIYSIQASLIFIDTISGAITRKDSVFTYLSSHTLGEYEHLRMTIDLSVPPAQAGIHRIVLRDRINPGVGQLYGGNADLKNFAGNGLMLSDVILAESEDGAWQRGDAKLGLVPPRQFEEKKPLKLFYEIYNLPASAAYRTEISMAPVEGSTGFGRIRRLFGGGDGKIELQFDGQAPAYGTGTLQELKQVTAEVKPGRYKVVVRVTNLEDQQSVRSETLFLVSPRSKKK